MANMRGSETQEQTLERLEQNRHAWQAREPLKYHRVGIIESVAYKEGCARFSIDAIHYKCWNISR